VKEQPDDQEPSDLGMDARMTRRDFLNGSLLGTGAALLGAACPAHAMFARASAGDAGAEAQAKAFDGYGGVGDYAASNGNVHAVISSAHKIRDGAYEQAELPAKDTGEAFDLVIVGGGLAGLMAAYQYAKLTGGARKVLVLENHPIFGGEAKQNDFDVDGVHLIGPQGSNEIGVPLDGRPSLANDFFNEFGVPRAYRFQEWDAKFEALRFSLENYSNMDGFGEQNVDVAYYFGHKDGAAEPGWRRNIWQNGLAETPYSERQRRDLLRWRSETSHEGEDDPRHLDTMTYKTYLEQVKGYDPAVTQFCQPVVGLLAGVGADAASARLGHMLVASPQRRAGSAGHLTISYPGGNSLLARYLVNAIVPGAIAGQGDFAGILGGGVNFGVLDRPGQATRIRLRSTVVRVRHEKPDYTGGVRVCYERGGELQAVKAKAVIMASGGWVNRHILRDMPQATRAAYDQFGYAPALIANVALRNWRFIYKLKSTALRWIDDGTMFGFSANIRRNIVTDGYNPPLDPDKPTLLTFYTGLYTPGHDARTQGVLGRVRLINTSYAQFEWKIRSQMAAMFGGLGFDPARDIAGIVLNRWGHARLVQPPGFYYGRDGEPSPREVVARGYGQILIAHSELDGEQHYTGAFKHGTRAAYQAVELTA
jgi:spermidine dehydrogenase